MDDENGKQGLETSVKEEDKGIDLENVNFKYDLHALKTIIDDVSLTIPKGKVTAIVHTPLQTAEGSVFTAQVMIMDCKYNLVSGMTGTASILVSNESILQRIIQRTNSNLLTLY